MPVLVQFVEGAERFFFPQALQPGQRGDPVGPGQDRLAVRLVELLPPRKSSASCRARVVLPTCRGPETNSICRFERKLSRNSSCKLRCMILTVFRLLVKK